MNDSMMIYIEKTIYASMDDEIFFSPLTFSPGSATGIGSVFLSQPEDGGSIIISFLLIFEAGTKNTINVGTKIAYSDSNLGCS